MLSRSPSKASGKYSLGSRDSRPTSKATKPEAGSPPRSRQQQRRKPHSGENVEQAAKAEIELIDKEDNALFKLIQLIDIVNIKLEMNIEQLVTSEPSLLFAVDIASRDNCLHEACSKIHIFSSSLVCFLIDSSHGGLMAKNTFGMLPIHKAMLAKPRFVSKRIRLNESNEDVLNSNQSPLALDSIYMLIEACPESLVCQNIEGQTPLHCCLSHSHASTCELVECILEESFGIESTRIVDNYGYSPVHLAARNKHTVAKTMELLLAAFPLAASIVDKKGNTPLHWAVDRNEPNISIVMLLVKVNPQAIITSNYRTFSPIDILLVRPPCGAINDCVQYLLTIKASLRPPPRLNSPAFMSESDHPAKRSGKHSPSQFTHTSTSEHGASYATQGH